MKKISGAFVVLVAAFVAAGCMPPSHSSVPASGGGGGGDPYGGGGDPCGGEGGGEDGGYEHEGYEEAAAPSGPTVVSVTLRNSCPETVRLFLGDKPKFGSGTTTTLGSNNVTSYSMQPGDMIWIVDESDNGVSSATVSDRTREIEIGSSCTDLSER